MGGVPGGSVAGGGRDGCVAVVTVVVAVGGEDYQ